MQRKQRKSKRKAPRNWDAVEAHFKTGAGTMGGGKKQNNKKNRAKDKQDIRKLEDLENG